MNRLRMTTTLALTMLAACGGGDGLDSPGTRTDDPERDGGNPPIAHDAGATEEDATPSGPDGSPEAGTDAAPEVGLDASPEAAPDVAPDGCAQPCSLGDVQCDNNGVQVCEWTSSGCLAWSTTEPCPTGKVCSGGACVDTCTDQCSTGAKKCTGNATQYCDVQTTGCLDWSVATLCPSGTTCTGGECTCVDECQEGSSQCSGNAVQSCAMQASGCTSWGPGQTCPQGTVCSAGQCSLTCQNACSPGATQCTQGGMSTCTLQSSGCYDWSVPVSCPVGTTCQSGVCSCSDVCTEGAKQCEGNAVQTCTTQSSGCTDWSAPKACAASEVCAAGECKPLCGDGQVTGEETCDTAIPSGPDACPTACPRTELCVNRTLFGKSTCQAMCTDTPITQTGARDMCCVQPGDPDCPTGYPLTVDEEASSVNYGQIGCSPSWNEKSTHMTPYLALAPTQCGLPVRLTAYGVSPGLGSGTARLEIEPSTIGATYLPTDTLTTLPPNEGAQTAFTIGMSDSAPTFLDVDYRVDVCSQSYFNTELYLDARAMEGVPTNTPADAALLVGDMTGQHVVAQKNGALTVTAGRFLPSQFKREGWSATLQPSTWTSTGTATLASQGVTDFGATVQPLTELGAYTTTTPPAAHVVWSTGNELHYAKVSGSGTSSAASVIHSGIGLSQIDVVTWTETALGIVWRESVAGKSVLRFVRASLASTGATLGTIVDVTQGEGDARDPALSLTYSTFPSETWNAGLVWVDTRSGAAQLYFQRIDGNTGTPMGTPEVVSNDAIDPESPHVQSLYNQGAFRILWTDRRNGHRSVFMKDNLEAGLTSAVVPFAGEPEDALSPAGRDVQKGQWGSVAPHIYRTSSNTRVFTVPRADTTGFRVTWIDTQTQVPQLARVRFWTANRYEIMSGTPMPLSCAPAASVGLFALLSDWNTYHGPDVRVNASHELAVWVEGGKVMTQGVSGTTFGRFPL